jgi:hypothetical protein
LEQEELRPCKSLVCKEAPGDECRFAGTRLGMEHEQITRRQRPGDLIEMGIKRQGGDFIRDHGMLFWIAGAPQVRRSDTALIA